jgi:hypothetical protein
MKSRMEIENRILELTPEFELAEESYFSAIDDKCRGLLASQVEFARITLEYESIKKEIEALDWVLGGSESKAII